MTQKFHTETVKIGEGVRSSEATADELQLMLSDTLRTMIAARGHPTVPNYSGQSAVMHLQSAQRKLAAAQSDMFRAHQELEQLAERMGIDNPFHEKQGSLDDENITVAMAA